MKVPKGKGAALASRVSGSELVGFDEATSFFITRLDRIKKERNTFSKYRVRKGDTVGTIARRFGVGQRTLMAANGIRNANRIRIGQKLKIPGRSGRSSYSNSPVSYKVRRGDSLSKIAKKFSTSMSRLKSLNSGLSSKIFPGQKIRVK